ncbi:MAG TPA: hypothetical protein VKU88_04455 [Acidimicrobiales bacterium]|nr:hypothetical protein [Acidimicrobiales bacterium]
MPELRPGRDEDEVGYQLEDWADSDRGWLIEQLNDLGILHRFEGDELVVDVGDEARVDDLVALIGEGEEAAADGEEQQVAEAGPPADDPAVASAVRLLADAAARLHVDPTDMQADADVAEASAAVLMARRFGALDEEAWEAVGRVTRRLLTLLGADEALDEQIRAEAAVLEKLLAPLAGPASPSAAAGERTVYEMSDWLPEQRAELEVLLDEAGVGYEWNGDELLVPAEREADVDAIFERAGNLPAPDDGGESDFDAEEARYQAVAELFAASGRLAGDPGDPQKAATVVEWAARVQGPPLIGMDEVDWFHITNRTRALVAAIDQDDADLAASEASALHELLRRVV